MVCIHCGAETAVFNSRWQKRLNQIWRRRRCIACTALFTTHEQIDYAAVWLVKTKTGQLAPFSRDKLYLSLHNCLDHRLTAISDAASLTDTIISKLRALGQAGVINSLDIVDTTEVALNRFDKTASVRYIAFHQR